MLAVYSLQATTRVSARRPPQAAKLLLQGWRTTTLAVQETRTVVSGKPCGYGLAGPAPTPNLSKFGPRKQMALWTASLAGVPSRTLGIYRSRFTLHCVLDSMLLS